MCDVYHGEIDGYLLLDYVIIEYTRMAINKRLIMTEITLETERLILRPPKMEDAWDMKTLLQERDISENIDAIPYPYPDEMAQKQLREAIQHIEDENGYYFMITLKSSGELMGAVYSYHRPVHLNTTLTYWLGKPYRGKKYISEAVLRVMKYGFEEDKFHRIWAMVHADNEPASQILKKVGMKHEGILREHIYDGEGFRDVEYYGMLRKEWEANVS